MHQTCLQIQSIQHAKRYNDSNPVASIKGYTLQTGAPRCITTIINLRVLSGQRNRRPLYSTIYERNKGEIYNN